MRLDFRHLQQIEAGTVNVTLATILRICDAFKVCPWAILPGIRSTKLKLGVDPPHRILRVAAIRAFDPPGMVRESGYRDNPIEPPPVAETVELKKRVGSNIQRIRMERDLTQIKLAAAMTMSVKYLQAVEGGKQNLSLDSLVKFARVLGVDALDLLMAAR